jgi:hypothetical protein
MKRCQEYAIDYFQDESGCMNEHVRMLVGN